MKNASPKCGTGNSKRTNGITKRETKTSTVYDVRYRGPDRKSHKRTFRRKIDAESFLTATKADMQRGEWIDPRAGRQTFQSVAAQWLEVADVKASTRSGYESILNRHLLPRFGTTPVGMIRTPDVEAFLAQLRNRHTNGTRSGKAQSGTVRNVRNAMSAVMRYAQRSGMIASNPVTATKAPRKTGAPTEQRFLSADEVARLVDATDERYRLAVQLDAYTGLRAGELWALKVGRVDLLRRRLIVAESVAEVHGAQITTTPKNGTSRTVPIPRFLVDPLTEHLAPYADDPTRYVFSAPHGGAVRHSSWYARYFVPAARTAGLASDSGRYDGPRFHDLRHTAVAFMIAAGASPLVVSRVIGHGSISVTYDTYGHILPDHADELADGLDAIHAAAASGEARVVPIRGVD